MQPAHHTTLVAQELRVDGPLSFLQPSQVTFTGGLGAQIFSYAILQFWRLRDIEVSPELSYFDVPPHNAIPGGHVSRWRWELDSFGIRLEDLRAQVTGQQPAQAPLADGVEKTRQAVYALRLPQIQTMFPGQTKEATVLGLGLDASLIDHGYLAVHIRRGDYLNVFPEDLVPHSAYEQAAKKFSKLLDIAVIVSDSSIPLSVSYVFKEHFSRVLLVDGQDHDVFLVHNLLRNAAVQLGSNGQFSLTAGLLSQSLFLTPRLWFRTIHPEIQQFMSELGDFTLVSDSFLSEKGIATPRT